MIEAGQQERKRLERNLHDGAQQRLIALSLELGEYSAKLADDPEAQAQIEAARKEIAVSLEELRAVARGLHPAVLTRPRTRCRARVAGRLLARPGEAQRRASRTGSTSRSRSRRTTSSAESLANIGKHAKATTATVDVTREGDEIVVEVVDDGVGGADSERGSGLRGLADRVEALGGRLRVWTPSGGGTRVRAQMPCA